MHSFVKRNVHYHELITTQVLLIEKIICWEYINISSGVWSILPKFKPYEWYSQFMIYVTLGNKLQNSFHASVGRERKQGKESA